MQLAKAAVFDFALVGSSVKAHIIAGLLAKRHKKRVCLIARRTSQHQLVRNFELSFDCVTRPETWNMLAALDPESTKLLTLIGGRRCLMRINPLIICHTKASHDALAHIHHLAGKSGYEMERLAGSCGSGAPIGFRLRGARVLRHNILWPAMLSWLEKNGVEIIEPSQRQILFHRDGGGLISNGGSKIEAANIVLADDEAVLEHAGKNDRERFFITCKATSVTSAPSARFSDQFILSPEHKFAAMAKKKGQMEFLALVGAGDMPALINANVALEKNVLRAGQSSFDTLMPHNGAPVAGKLGRSNFLVLCGFGYAGAYFAPALARFLVDECTQQEKDYFEPRCANSARRSNEVAEFQQVMAAEGK
ncbi:hypothetical protein MNBD_ALPHA12-412 [hydrothermal vent metagenome]|uniref:FAD dependent oxidoreductase domain-containing protein n=1 Tax=hydrothermal vent metagenome TaxID=652676 RepID=A0A3B0TTM5_9ZZZZ